MVESGATKWRFCDLQRRQEIDTVAARNDGGEAGGPKALQSVDAAMRPVPDIGNPLP
jgi:hypothetical protein